MPFVGGFGLPAVGLDQALLLPLQGLLPPKAVVFVIYSQGPGRGRIGIGGRVYEAAAVLGDGDGRGDQVKDVAGCRGDVFLIGGPKTVEVVVWVGLHIEADGLVGRGRPEGGAGITAKLEVAPGPFPAPALDWLVGRQLEFQAGAVLDDGDCWGCQVDLDLGVAIYLGRILGSEADPVVVVEVGRRRPARPGGGRITA